MTTEKVDVELRLQASQFESKLTSLTSSVGNLTKMVAGIATSYVGFQAVSSMLGGVVKNTIGYTNEVQNLQLGLTTVMSAVEKLPWDQATGKASAAFNELNKLAMKSPVGPKEMLQVFQGIYGPARAAGAAMADINTMTGNAVLAAGALGEDLGQAQRDISGMMRGTAGMDNKLFSMMTSMGLIVESTEQWNKKLTGAERFEKLQAALKNFEKSGDAAGKTMQGRISTVLGQFQELGRAMVTPAFSVVANALGRLSDYLDKNMTSLTNWAQIYGDRIASLISRAIDAGTAAFKWMAKEVLPRLEAVMNFFKGISPTLGKLGGVVGAVSAARGGVVGNIASAAGSAIGAGSGAAGGLAGGAVVSGIVMAIVANFDVLKKYLGGTFMTTLNTLVDMFSTVWTALQPWLTLFGTLILAVVVPQLKSLLAQFNALWALLKPIVQIVGKVGEVLLFVAKVGFEKLLDVLDTLEDVFKPVFDVFNRFTSDLAYIADQFGSFIDKLLGDANRMRQDEKEAAFAEQEKGSKTTGTMGGDRAFDFISTALTEPNGKKPAGETPAQRGGTNINVQNMTIKQEFRGKADPDRVVAAFAKAITRQAESKISAGGIPVFSR